MCNNKCLHCSSNASPFKKQELNFDIIKDIINQYNPEWINLSGGELLSHNDFVRIVEYIHNKNIKIKLYTSGYCCDFNYILESIYKYINTIVFPYYSNCKNVFNFITDTNSYQETHNSIKYALSLGINVEIHIVPMTINLNTLDSTINDLIKLGINKINLLKLVNQGRCNFNQYLLLDDRILSEEINTLSKKYGSIIKLGLPLSHGECVAGKEKIVVMSDGKVIPCESYKDGICKCERIVI
jgi:MoaA/NifB/PqqE/SkfB family radical SAM enzyme